MIETRTPTQYLASLKADLPSGPAWPAVAPRRDAMLGAVAEMLSEAEGRFHRLLEEADPRTTDEMLGEWETSYGLPGPCGATSAEATKIERLDALAAKVRMVGSLGLPFYEQMIASLGYEAAIEEFRPFECGVAECGGELGEADGQDRNLWRVAVDGPRIVDFECGVSECADHLGRVIRAEDLECALRLHKPSHTTLIFSYEGA